VLWVRSKEHAIAGSDDAIAALERLVSTLGGTLLVREGDDLVAVTTQVAHERETTYVLIGRPRRRTPPGRLAHQRCRCS
jgi:K+-sensing histidine kinase KdpD